MKKYDFNPLNRFLSNHPFHNLNLTNNASKIFFAVLILPFLSGSYPHSEPLESETNAMDSCAITCAGKSTISRAALIMQATDSKIKNKRDTTNTVQFIRPIGIK